MDGRRLRISWIALKMALMSEGPGLPNPGRSSRSAIICWIVILVTIGYVAAGVFVRKSSRFDTADSKRATANMDLELSARVLVGQKLLALAFNQQPISAREALATLDAKATSLNDKLHAAIVAGELAGGDNALERVRELRAATTRPMSDDLVTLERIYRDQRDGISPEQRSELIKRHRWFGQLALAFNLAGTDPQRKKATAPAMRAAWSAVGAVFFIGALVVTGVILLIAAIVLFARGTVRRRFVPVRASVDRPAFLEAFAIYIALFVIFGDVMHRIIATPPLILYLLTTLLLPIALIWPTRRGMTMRDSRRGFGWHRGDGIFTEMGCGLIGYITGLPIMAIAFVITFYLAKLSSSSPSHPIMNELGGGVGAILGIYFLACIWAPIMEETMFRGALFNHLRGRWGWLMSSLIVGLMFALMHPQGWTAIPVIGSIGAVLASVREWRGSLIGPMTAHALNNATAITVVLLLIR